MQKKENFLLSLSSLSGILLVLYYSVIVFNARNGMFFVSGKPNFFLDQIITILSPWLIPLISTLCGIFSYRLFKRETSAGYIKKQAAAFLVPFLVSFFIISPLLFYFSRLQYANTSDNFFRYIVRYFSKAFTLNAFAKSYEYLFFWIFIFLFIFSMISLLIMKFLKYAFNYSQCLNLPSIVVFLCGLIFMFVPRKSAVYLNVIDIFISYMLGFFILSNEIVYGKLKNVRHYLASIWIALLVLACFLDFSNTGSFLAVHIVNRLLTWVAVLGAIALCKRYFDADKNIFVKNGRMFFSYLFFSCLAVVFSAYFILKFVSDSLIACILVYFCSMVVILVLHHFFSIFKVTRVLFGLKLDLFEVYDENI